jgi:hypothetical protein
VHLDGFERRHAVHLGEQLSALHPYAKLFGELAFEAVERLLGRLELAAGQIEDVGGGALACEQEVLAIKERGRDDSEWGHVGPNGGSGGHIANVAGM